jgi:hypothetical protein
MNNGNIVVYGKIKGPGTCGGNFGAIYGEGREVCTDANCVNAGWKVLNRRCGSYTRDGNRFFLRYTNKSSTVSPNGAIEDYGIVEGNDQFVVEGRSCSGSSSSKYENTVSNFEIVSCTRIHGTGK